MADCEWCPSRCNLLKFLPAVVPPSCSSSKLQFLPAVVPPSCSSSQLKFLTDVVDRLCSMHISTPDQKIPTVLYCASGITYTVPPTVYRDMARTNRQLRPYPQTLKASRYHQNLRTVQQENQFFKRRDSTVKPRQLTKQ